MAEPRVTVKEAAFELAVSERTIRRWIDEGRLPAVKIGPTDRIRIDEAAIAEAKRPRPVAEE